MFPLESLVGLTIVLPTAVILVESLVRLVVLQVVRLKALLFDAAKRFAQLAHKVVLLQVGGDVILPVCVQPAVAALISPETRNKKNRHTLKKKKTTGTIFFLPLAYTSTGTRDINSKLPTGIQY
jgi:hypothetical protein